MAAEQESSVVLDFLNQHIYLAQMGIPRTHYFISSLKAKDLQHCLPAGMTVSALAPVSVKRGYFDSFDWRLFNKRSSLFVEQRDSEQKLVLCDLHETSIRTQMPNREIFQFYWQLPPCRLRQLLSPILKERALMPKLTLEGHIEVVLVRDSHSKTLLKIEHEFGSKASDGEHEPVALPDRLVLQPVKGFEAILDQVRPCIEQLVGVKSQLEGSYETALHKLGVAPASTAQGYDFESHSRAIDAIRNIGQVQLKTMLANQQGVLDDIDSEFLHDFRVAVRRTRTLLTQAKGMFADDILSWLKEEFRWLGQSTGHPRDMDVYLLHFPAYEQMLDESLRTDLKPLQDFLQAERAAAYRQLHDVLRSKRYQTLVERWGELLAEVDEGTPGSYTATQPIAQLADKTIWKTYRRVRKQGKAITPDSPAEDYHTLRKTCKKLRYLLEFYRHLYPKKEIKKRIAELKLLQDNLGQFQDYQVQQAHLRDFAEQMQKNNLAEVQTFLAMGKLIDTMLSQSEKVQQEFARCFAAFSDKQVHQHFIETFKPAKINSTSEDTGLL